MQRKGDSMRNYLTKDIIEKMKEEIEYRKVVERKRLIQDVKEARAHGDLSENFEYKAAKRERGKNESRIRYLERMIKTARVIEDHTKKGQVGLGKKVKLFFIEDELEMDVTLVTTMEVDAEGGKISIESPLGKAIFKKYVGDEVEVKAPEENYKVRIKQIY